MHKRSPNRYALVLTALMLCPIPLRAGAESGEALYRSHCASCHGRDGRGDGPDASVLSSPPRDLREGFLDKYSTDDLVQRILAGRPLALDLDPAALRQRASDVESVVAHLERLPRIDWPEIAPGWDVYAERCQSCHGPFGKPGGELPQGVRSPRNLADPQFQSEMRDENLVVAVRHGRRGMPALVPRLSEDDAVLVARFVRLLSPGMAVYTVYCARCHGDDGQGVRSPMGSFGMPSVRFDEAYFARHDPEELRSRVWHMLDDKKPRMPHFRREISEQQARAIVEYLKKRP